MSFSGKFSWLCQISWTTRKLYDRSYVFPREFKLAFLDYQKTVYDRSHVFQWEIQLAIQISGTTRKLYDRSHVFQWEIQLAISDFRDYQKTVWQVTCLSEGIQMAVSYYVLMCNKFWMQHDIYSSENTEQYFSYKSCIFESTGNSSFGPVLVPRRNNLLGHAISYVDSSNYCIW